MRPLKDIEAMSAPIENVARLTEYWMRAECMRQLVEEMMFEYDENLGDIHKSPHWMEFKAYLSFWFAGLFVVHEGYGRLGISDDRVTRVRGPQIRLLKGFRDETYHFDLHDKRSSEFIIHISWAEDYHDAIGDALLDLFPDPPEVATEQGSFVRRRLRGTREKRKT